MQTARHSTLDARSFVDEFAAGRIPPAAFDHRAHVRLAWSYLRCHPLAEVLDLLPRALRRFARAAGQPRLYHETITWTYVMTINERMHAAADGGADFDAFVVANADLLVWPSPLLTISYRSETLWSDRARRCFVWPDRLTGAAPRPSREGRE